MKHIKFQNGQVVGELKVFENRVYWWVSNPQVFQAFYDNLVKAKKDVTIRGKWIYREYTTKELKGHGLEEAEAFITEETLITLQAAGYTVVVLDLNSDEVFLS